MKKTLLSVTAALAVIGSACAVPSVEDRKALCEKHPEKYVWVAKDEMCVPINPCLSANQEMQLAYCKSKIFPFDISKRDIVVKRLAEKWWQTSIRSIKELPDLWFAVFTTDGDYFVGGRADAEQMTKDDAVDMAFYAYGYNARLDEGENGNYRIGYGVGSLEECDDIKDFASLLFENLIEGHLEGTACWLKVD